MALIIIVVNSDNTVYIVTSHALWHWEGNLNLIDSLAIASYA